MCVRARVCVYTHVCMSMRACEWAGRVAEVGGGGGGRGVMLAERAHRGGDTREIYDRWGGTGNR